MNEFLSKFITAFGVALVTALVPLVIGWVKLLFAKAAAELKDWKPELYTILEAGAKMAVEAAEQSNIAGLIEDKKEYAICTLQAYLNDHGFGDVSLETIDAAIEAAVKGAEFPHAE